MAKLMRDLFAQATAVDGPADMSSWLLTWHYRSLFNVHESEAGTALLCCDTAFDNVYWS